MFDDFTEAQLHQSRQILEEFHRGVLENLAGNRAGLRHICEDFIQALDGSLTKQQALDFLVKIYSKALSHRVNRLRDSDDDVTDDIRLYLEKSAAALGIENEIKQKFESLDEKDWAERTQRSSVKSPRARVPTRKVKWPETVNIPPLSLPAALIEFRNGENYFMQEITSLWINPENGDLYVRTFASDQQKALNLAHALNKHRIACQVGEHIVQIDSTHANAALSYLSGSRAGKFRITPECASAALSEHQKAIGQAPAPLTDERGQWTSRERNKEQQEGDLPPL